MSFPAREAADERNQHELFELAVDRLLHDLLALLTHTWAKPKPSPPGESPSQAQVVSIDLTTADRSQLLAVIAEQKEIIKSLEAQLNQGE